MEAQYDSSIYHVRDSTLAFFKFHSSILLDSLKSVLCPAAPSSNSKLALSQQTQSIESISCVIQILELPRLEFMKLHFSLFLMYLGNALVQSNQKVMYLEV